MWLLTYSISMGKSWPHTAASNYLYLFVWANLCILFILYFKLFFCNGPETEMKWKIGVQILYNICILSFTDSWCLVPFSSNISCHRTHNVRLCCNYKRSRVTKWRNSLVNSGVHSKKFLDEACHHKYISCNRNACQSEWGFGLEFVDEVHQMEWHG